MVATTEQAIEAQPAAPPLYSLLQVVETIEDAAGNIPNSGEPRVRWQQGVIWSPEQVGGGGVAAPLCAGDTALMGLGHNPFRNIADPISVFAEDHCSSIGFEDRDYEGRARRQLAATASFQVAKELEFGAIRTAAGLNNVALIDGVEVGPGTQPIEDAIGILESALAQKFQGARCMIHVTTQAFVEMMRKNLIYLSGQKWLTAPGNIVVWDAGYGAETTPEGAVYAYGTTMIQARLGPVTVVPGTFEEALYRAQALDKAVNTFELYAERLVLLQFDHTDVNPADLVFKVELDMPAWHVGS